MDTKRYSKDYVLRFKLIKYDDKRAMMYKIMSWSLRVILVLFILSFFEFLIPKKEYGELLLSFSLFRSLCLFIYFVTAMILRSRSKGGSIIMGGNSFIIKEDDKENMFMLNKVSNIEVKLNEDGYYRGFWKMYVIGILYMLINPSGKGNLLKFKYDERNLVYEVNLRSFSENLLFERRIKEWEEAINN